MEKNIVWIVTKAYNDYDQHGSYFVGVFNKKPDKQQLKHALKEWGEEISYYSDDFFDHLLLGGGRSNNFENEWYYLFEYHCE
jgi:hypothetical protein